MIVNCLCALCIVVFEIMQKSKLDKREIILCFRFKFTVVCVYIVHTVPLMRFACNNI